MAAAADLGRASAVERVAPDPGLDAACLLYERHADTVFRFCLSRLRSREEAEDARQTTFLNAFRALRRGVVPISESSWLLKIAENVCLTRRQDAQRRLAVEVTQDPQTLGQVAAPAQPDVELLMPLEEALGRLTELQRQALLLREWQGLSYREVAARLGIGQGAVEVLLFRARRALAEELEAPGRVRRRRVALDFGSLASVAKQLLGGATAIGSKSALTAIAVATAAAVSTVAVSLGPEGTRAAAPAVHVGTPPPQRAERPGVEQRRPTRAATMRVRAEKPQARARPAERPAPKDAPLEAPPSALAQAPRPPAEPTDATPLPGSEPPSQVVEEPQGVPHVIDEVATPLAPVAETGTDVLGDLVATGLVDTGLVDTAEIAEATASTVTAALPEPTPPEPAFPSAPDLP